MNARYWRGDMGRIIRIDTGKNSTIYPLRCAMHDTIFMLNNAGIEVHKNQLYNKLSKIRDAMSNFYTHQPQR